jgi:hypothetical protein
MESARVHVTLVHGTYARRARWVRSTSPMTTGLAAAGMTSEAFIWSGRNSHRARIGAAEDLAEHLRRQQQERPGTRQAVVAHSHGGNVALHAVRRLMSVRDGSIPVVALATPFLFASHRKIPRPALTVYLIGAGYLLVEGTVVVATGWWLDSLWLALLVFPMWLLVVLQTIAAGYWWFVHGPPWRSATRDRFVASVQAPNASDARLLVIRAADDEAATVLAVSQLAASGAVTVFRLTRPRYWIPTYAILNAMALFLGLPGEDISNMTTIAPFVLFAVGLGLTVLIFTVVALFSLAFGIDGPTASLVAYVSAEATPPGDYAVRQRPVREADAAGLSHSSLYDDPEVIGWVADHIKESVQRHPRGT